MHFSKNWPEILKNSHVRDLAWTVFSPSLLDEKSYLNVMQGPFLGLSDDDTKAFVEHLKKINSSPQSFERYLKENPSKKLGDYFERLVYYFLSHTPSCHKLEQRVVIKEREQTQGEFDFLFFSDHLGKMIHWEVCVKYYLLYGDKDNLTAYIGPNPEDTLEAKISTLKKQVALSRRAEGKRFLQKEKLWPIESAALVKGYIFYPLMYDATLAPTPTEGIAQKHHFGFWDRYTSNLWKARIEKLKIEHKTNEIRLFILPSLNWLSSPTFDVHDARFLKHSFTVDTFKKHDLPLMLGIFALNGDEWQEIERGILVSANWPN